MQRQESVVLAALCNMHSQRLHLRQKIKRSQIR